MMDTSSSSVTPTTTATTASPQYILANNISNTNTGVNNNKNDDEVTTATTSSSSPAMDVSVLMQMLESGEREKQLQSEMAMKQSNTNAMLLSNMKNIHTRCTAQRDALKKEKKARISAVRQTKHLKLVTPRGSGRQLRANAESVSSSPREGMPVILSTTPAPRDRHSTHSSQSPPPLVNHPTFVEEEGTTHHDQNELEQPSPPLPATNDARQPPSPPPQRRSSDDHYAAQSTTHPLPMPAPPVPSSSIPFAVSVRSSSTTSGIGGDHHLHPYNNSANGGVPTSYVSSLSQSGVTPKGSEIVYVDSQPTVVLHPSSCSSKAASPSGTQRNFHPTSTTMNQSHATSYHASLRNSINASSDINGGVKSPNSVVLLNDEEQLLYATTNTTDGTQDDASELRSTTASERQSRRRNREAAGGVGGGNGTRPDYSTSRQAAAALKAYEMLEAEGRMSYKKWKLLQSSVLQAHHDSSTATTTTNTPEAKTPSHGEVVDCTVLPQGNVSSSTAHSVGNGNIVQYSELPTNGHSGIANGVVMVDGIPTQTDPIVLSSYELEVLRHHAVRPPTTTNPTPTPTTGNSSGNTSPQLLSGMDNVLSGNTSPQLLSGMDNVLSGNTSPQLLSGMENVLSFISVRGSSSIPLGIDDQGSDTDANATPNTTIVPSRIDTTTIVTENVESHQTDVPSQPTNTSEFEQSPHPSSHSIPTSTSLTTKNAPSSSSSRAAVQMCSRSVQSDPITAELLIELTEQLEATMTEAAMSGGAATHPIPTNTHNIPEANTSSVVYDETDASITALTNGAPNYQNLLSHSSHSGIGDHPTHTSAELLNREDSPCPRSPRSSSHPLDPVAAFMSALERRGTPAAAGSSNMGSDDDGSFDDGNRTLDFVAAARTPSSSTYHNGDTPSTDGSGYLDPTYHHNYPMDGTVYSTGYYPAHAASTAGGDPSYGTGTLPVPPISLGGLAIPKLNIGGGTANTNVSTHAATNNSSKVPPLSFGLGIGLLKHKNNNDDSAVVITLPAVVDSSPGTPNRAGGGAGAGGGRDGSEYDDSDEWARSISDPAFKERQNVLHQFKALSMPGSTSTQSVVAGNNRRGEDSAVSNGGVVGDGEGTAFGGSTNNTEGRLCLKTSDTDHPIYYNHLDSGDEDEAREVPRRRQLTFTESVPPLSCDNSIAAVAEINPIATHHQNTRNNNNDHHHCHNQHNQQLLPSLFDGDLRGGCEGSASVDTAVTCHSTSAPMEASTTGLVRMEAYGGSVTGGTLLHTTFGNNNTTTASSTTANANNTTLVDAFTTMDNEYDEGVLLQVRGDKSPIGYNYDVDSAATLVVLPTTTTTTVGTQTTVTQGDGVVTLDREVATRSSGSSPSVDGPVINNIVTSAPINSGALGDGSIQSVHEVSGGMHAHQEGGTAAVPSTTTEEATVHSEHSVDVVNESDVGVMSEVSFSALRQINSSTIETQTDVPYTLPDATQSHNNGPTSTKQSSLVDSACQTDRMTEPEQGRTSTAPSTPYAPTTQQHHEVDGNTTTVVGGSQEGISALDTPNTVGVHNNSHPDHSMDVTSMVVTPHNSMVAPSNTTTDAAVTSNLLLDHPSCPSCGQTKNVDHIEAECQTESVEVLPSDVREPHVEDGVVPPPAAQPHQCDDDEDDVLSHNRPSIKGYAQYTTGDDDLSVEAGHTNDLLAPGNTTIMADEVDPSSRSVDISVNTVSPQLHHDRDGLGTTSAHTTAARAQPPISSIQVTNAEVQVDLIVVPSSTLSHTINHNNNNMSSPLDGGDMVDKSGDDRGHTSITSQDQVVVVPISKSVLVDGGCQTVLDYTTTFPEVQGGATITIPPPILSVNSSVMAVSAPSSPNNSPPSTTPIASATPTPIATDGYIIVPSTVVPSHANEVNASTSQPPSPVVANATPFSTFPSVEVSSMDDVSVDVSDPLLLTHPPPVLRKAPAARSDEHGDPVTDAVSQQTPSSPEEQQHQSVPLQPVGVSTASCQTLDVFISDYPLPSLLSPQNMIADHQADREVGSGTATSSNTAVTHPPIQPMINAESQTFWDSPLDITNATQPHGSVLGVTDEYASAPIVNTHHSERGITSAAATPIPSTSANIAAPTSAEHADTLKAMQSELEELRSSESTSRRRNEYLMSALSKRSEELARVSKLLDNANNQLAELYISQSASAVAAAKAQQAARFTSTAAATATTTHPSQPIGDVVGNSGVVPDPLRKDGGEDSQPGKHSATLIPLSTETDGDHKNHHPADDATTYTSRVKQAATAMHHPVSSHTSRGGATTAPVGAMSSSMKQPSRGGTTLTATTRKAGAHTSSSLSSTQRSNVNRGGTQTSTVSGQQHPPTLKGRSLPRTDVKGRTATIPSSSSLGATTTSTSAARRPGTMGSTTTSATAIPTSTRTLPSTLKPRK